MKEGLGLMQEVETRWNSKLENMKSVQKALPRLKELLLKEKQKAALLLLDRPIVSQIINVLQPIEDATKLFSLATAPTLHLKATVKISLISTLQKQADNFQTQIGAIGFDDEEFEDALKSLKDIKHVKILNWEKYYSKLL